MLSTEKTLSEDSVFHNQVTIYLGPTLVPRSFTAVSGLAYSMLFFAASDFATSLVSFFLHPKRIKKEEIKINLGNKCLIFYVFERNKGKAFYIFFTYLYSYKNNKLYLYIYEYHKN